MKKREIKRIVMTGPTGAVGMAIIRECIKQGISMLLITREDSARNERIPKSEYISILYADISEYDGIYADEKTEGNFDAFIHLAWAGTIGGGRNDMELQSDNIKYTLAAVRLAKRLGCKVFLGAGSQAEYGRVEGFLNSETPSTPSLKRSRAFPQRELRLLKTLRLSRKAFFSGGASHSGWAEWACLSSCLPFSPVRTTIPPV